MATPNSLSEYRINRIKEDVKHPLYYDINFDRNIERDFFDFLHLLFDKTAVEARGRLESKISRLSSRDHWLSFYDELKVMYRFLEAKLDASFMVESQAAKPDIVVRGIDDNLYFEVKSLIHDEVLEEIKKIYKLKKISSGKLAIVHFQINQIQGYEFQIKAINEIIEDIKGRLLSEDFSNYQGDYFKLEFRENKKVPVDTTIFIVDRGALFIDEDYLMRKMKYLLESSLKQIQSEDNAILFLVSNDWRFTQDNYQAVLYGHNQKDIAYSSNKTSQSGLFDIRYINKELLIQSFPHKDGMFWELEAVDLPAVAIITKLTNWDEYVIPVYQNPFCTKSNNAMNLISQL